MTKRKKKVLDAVVEEWPALWPVCLARLRRGAGPLLRRSAVVVLRLRAGELFVLRRVVAAVAAAAVGIHRRRRRRPGLVKGVWVVIERIRHRMFYEGRVGAADDREED